MAKSANEPRYGSAPKAYREPEQLYSYRLIGNKIFFHTFIVINTSYNKRVLLTTYTVEFKAQHGFNLISLDSRRVCMTINVFDFRSVSST